MILAELHPDEVECVAQLLATSLHDSRWNEWTDPVQPRFFNAIFRGLFGYRPDFWSVPVGAFDRHFALKMSRPARELAVAMMVGGELLCRPIPENVHANVERWAADLGVEGPELLLARETAAGAYQRAQSDLYRHGYWGSFSSHFKGVSEQVDAFGVRAYAATVESNPAQAERWRRLEDCAGGTLGRSVWEFYVIHGFLWPGEPGAANEITAHHDWIHVLADYSATGLGEIETAAFRLTSTKLPGTMLTFLGELGFWHSGMIGSAFSGWHEAYSLDARDAPESVADALSRGAQCTRDLYLDLDFFDYKDRDLAELREEWNIPPKKFTTSPDWKTAVRLTAADGESDGPPQFPKS